MLKTKKEDIGFYYKENENELNKSDEKKNPYNAEPCPFCGEYAVGSCRCCGPHSLDDLKKGHGLRCKNGHKFTHDGNLGYDPHAGKIIGKDNSGKPTEEMREFFQQRTEQHISLVKENMKKVAEHLNPNDKLIFLARSDNHDQSKFKEPNYTPYVWTTWMYKCKKDGVPFEYPDGMQEKCNDATIRHVMMEPHHPEYFAGEAPINQDNRDMSDKSIDARGMPPLNIMEMVCDWKAVGQERGNKAYDWYVKNVPSRWDFSDKQKELIETTIKILE